MHSKGNISNDNTDILQSEHCHSYAFCMLRQWLHILFIIPNNIT